MNHIIFGISVLTAHRKMCGQVTQIFWAKKNPVGAGCDYHRERLILGKMVWWECGVAMYPMTKVIFSTF